MKQSSPVAKEEKARMETVMNNIKYDTKRKPDYALKLYQEQLKKQEDKKCKTKKKI